MYLKTLFSLVPFIIGGTDAVYWISRRDVQTSYEVGPQVYQCEQDQSVWFRKFKLNLLNIFNLKFYCTEYLCTLNIM